MSHPIVARRMVVVALNLGILPLITRLDMLQADAVSVRPKQQLGVDALRSVVAADSNQCTGDSKSSTIVVRSSPHSICPMGDRSITLRILMDRG